jgi:hypothetical protein
MEARVQQGATMGRTHEGFGGALFAADPGVGGFELDEVHYDIKRGKADARVDLCDVLAESASLVVGLEDRGGMVEDPVRHR